MPADQYRNLQKIAGQTEVELFSEPYENLCLFSVERTNYAAFVDYADLSGIGYTAHSERPTRDELLADMQ